MRVNPSAVVVAPFDCAWLTAPDSVLQDGRGCISFEFKGNNDVTLLFKKAPGSRRWQHSTTVHGVHPESNYTVILGSHRNSCLKIEKNGMLCSAVHNVALARLPSDAFMRCWVNFDRGEISIGVGQPGSNVSHTWHDPEPIDGIAYAGLSAWDSHVIYRAIQVLPALSRQEISISQEPDQLGNDSLEMCGSAMVPVPHQTPSAVATSAVPSLLTLAADEAERGLSPGTAAEALEVAEALGHAVPTLRSTAIAFAAAHLDEVLDIDGGQPLAHTVTAPTLAALLQVQVMSVRSEFRLFELVMRWWRVQLSASDGRRDLHLLLPHVRFPLMSSEELEAVQATTLWQEGEPLLRALVDEALVGQSPDLLGEMKQSIDPHSNSHHSWGDVAAKTISSTLGASIPTALEAEASARFLPRSPPGCVELLFVCPGDNNGALHWLGTRGGRQPWVNPARSGAIRVWASSPACRSTCPEALTAPGIPKLNFAAPRAEPKSKGQRVAFWAVDLGPKRTLACAAYTLRHDASRDPLRSWRFQGTEDEPSAAVWEDLRVHVGDGTLLLPGRWGVWHVLGRAAGRRYRAFRVLVEAPQEGNDNPWHASLAQIELYGQLFGED